ncbi:MAG: DUF5814 domain-containing protein [Candidatus Heimdallarchaeota archaeon]
MLSQNINRIYLVIMVPISQKRTILILGFSRGKINQSKPLIRGKIEYNFKHGNLWRPWRIHWEEHGKWKPYPPNKDMIQKLLQKSRKILLDSGLTTKEKGGIQKFCKDFNIDTIINEVLLCPFCIASDKYSILKSNNTYLAYKREVCKTCAIEELEKDLNARKVSLLSSPGFKKYALSLLDRFHNTEQVITVLTSKEPVVSDLTLVQKLDKSSKKELPILSLPITEFGLPDFLVEVLRNRGITIFLPVQTLSLRAGLLENKSQLIIANTSAGKTLIGEMAGVCNIKKAKNKKFIFTVPLVALANTKFDDFKRLYEKQQGIRVGIRVGRSRIFDSLKEKKKFYRDRYSLAGADIIVATYEGLDLLFRAGQLNFDEVGTIVIDEAQSLADPDRGPMLDCLLAKIRVYASGVQVVALSATVGNPKQFASDLSLELVTFDHRPIPLEEHLLISRSVEEKMRQIRQLCESESRLVSKSGSRGQTIVFTNSRRRTAEIADYLGQIGSSRMKAKAYHSGLSYTLRRQIEREFSSGKCPVVISTYALGAGVDFPASQVIFESMMMGNKPLDPNSFTQMLGRAGRLGKHDRGRVIFLCLGEEISSLDSRSEIEIAFQLLNSELAPIEPNHNGDACAEQILSICSSAKQIDPNDAKQIYQQMIGTTSFPFMEHANYLIKKGFLRVSSTNRRDKRVLEVTSLGRAATLSFFSPNKVLSIVTMLRRGKHFVPIALEMNPLRNIYLSRKLHAYLEKTYHMRFSTRLINSPVLDVMMASLKGKESTELNKWCLNVFSKWTQSFFKCSCPENPYCEHGQQEIGRFIVDERLDGKNVGQIATTITKFELLIYPGDVLSFLNGFIHELEGIQLIAQAIDRTKLGKNIELLINRLETPSFDI